MVHVSTRKKKNQTKNEKRAMHETPQDKARQAYKVVKRNVHIEMEWFIKMV